MMSVVFKNTSALLVSHTIGRLLSLLLTVLILPNYFTEQQIGSYLLAMFVTSLIASITELGMQALSHHDCIPDNYEAVGLRQPILVY